MNAHRTLAPSAQALRDRGAALVDARRSARRDLALKAVGAATVALYDASESHGPESDEATEAGTRVTAAVERYRGMA